VDHKIMLDTYVLMPRVPTQKMLEVLRGHYDGSYSAEETYARLIQESIAGLVISSGT
jgi:hypothetical protein